ncbi:MAG TPA: response regulator [Thermoguttaceae bacterium]|nr:response regulator [Thermoguttaceae bacterium]
MGQKTILLVDDDPAHISLIQRGLNRVCLGCQVDVVRNGTEAIDYLLACGSHAGRDPAPMPQLVLLDLTMPKLDGFQVLQVLRRVTIGDRFRLPPVVVFTASRKRNDVSKAYRLGAQGFVQKPGEFCELIETLRLIVTYWLELNEFPPACRFQKSHDDVRRSPVPPAGNPVSASAEKP